MPSLGGITISCFLDWVYFNTKRIIKWSFSLICTVIENLKSIDEALLIWFNQFHSPTWDVAMLFITDRLVWIPFYLLIIATIIYFYRLQARWLVPGMILAVTISDQIASGLFKPLTKRLRPCHNDDLLGILYNAEPERCGGMYSFFSSHAANTFCLATIVTLLLYRWNKWVALIFVWAAVNSYSRIYLIKHYPFDVLTGAVTGSLVALFIYYLMKRLKLFKPIHSLS